MERQEQINEEELRGLFQKLSREHKIKVVESLRLLGEREAKQIQPHYRYASLRLAIAKRYGTQAAFAKATGIPVSSLSRALRNLQPFKQQEIVKCVEALEIEDKDIQMYFFMPYHIPDLTEV